MFLGWLNFYSLRGDVGRGEVYVGDVGEADVGVADVGVGGAGTGTGTGTGGPPQFKEPAKIGPLLTCLGFL